MYFHGLKVKKNKQNKKSEVMLILKNLPETTRYHQSAKTWQQR